MATAGTPVSVQWDRQTGIFTYRYRADPEISAPTELFIPAEWFGPEPAVEVRAKQNKAAKPIEKPAGIFGKKKSGELKITTQYQSGLQRLLITAANYAGEIEVTVSHSR
jgi:hypothetical protein